MNSDSELIQSLELNQLTAITERPLPRRQLGRGALFLLFALRIYVLIAIPLVGYAFIKALYASP